MESTNIENGVFKVAEIELVYKSKIKPADRPQISCSKDAYEILILHWDDAKIELLEQFKVVFLNRANRVLGILDLATGGTAEVVCDTKIIFAAALKANASRIVLAHNHPSGSLRPSEQDRKLTIKIKMGGDLLGIKVIEHLIVTPAGYFSFADEGEL